MKKYWLLFVVYLLFNKIGTSQSFKGQWQTSLLLSGRSKIVDVSTGRELKDQAIFLSPNVGFWVSDNTQLGLSFPLVFTQQNIKYPDNFLYAHQYREFRFGIAPYVRQQFFKTKLRPFVHLQAGYNFDNYKSFYIDGSVKSGNDNTIGLNMGSGLVYYLKDKIGIEAMVSYNPLRESNYNQKIQYSIGGQYRFKK